MRTESVHKLVPRQHDGRATVGPANDFPILEETFRGDRGLELQQRQATDEPQVILIDGVLSLGELVEQLGDPQLAENLDGVVTVRRPLVVKPAATLIVDGKSTPTVRLATDRGVFLANAGRLLMVDAVMSSWDEATSQPTVFVAKLDFRPFITSYVRSETYVAGCTIQHLGFAAPSAYGFSLTSHPDRNRGEPSQDWPTGVIVGNGFRGMY